MSVYKCNAKMMRHLVPYSHRDKAKAGELVPAHIPGVTVKKYSADGRYYVYTDPGVNIPDYMATTEVEKGHATLYFKHKSRVAANRAQKKSKGGKRSEQCLVI